MRDKLRLSLGYCRETLLQNTRNGRMKVVATTTDETCVGRILYEGMFEGVGRDWRRSPAGDEPRCSQLLERHFELPRGQRRYRRNQLVGELAPDHGADL